MSVTEHLERFLGEIEVGWSLDPDGHKMPFQVVRFGRGGGPGSVAFATVGLSSYPLRSPTSKKEIRQELVMDVPEELKDGPVPGLLQQVGMEALSANSALLRGDVIGPRGRLFAGSPMEAIYVAIPVYFPDDFAGCRDRDGDIIVAWLVPIASSEARYVAERGWDAFEDRLIESDPDLTDVFRAPLAIE